MTISEKGDETVATGIDGVGRGSDVLDGRLSNLKNSAGDFVAKVAAWLRIVFRGFGVTGLFGAR